MRGRPPRHVADISLQLLHEQQVVPFQFNGWHGLLVQDFPVFFPELEEILYEVSTREIALIPIEEHGTLLVSLTRGYDPSHGPLPDLAAQAVLFTSDPLERRAIRVTASDEWTAFEQVCAYFSLPSREDVDEQCSALTSAAAQGMLHGNVYYRLPGWTGWCSIFFPTVVDRALMALMVYSGEGAQYSARVVRFSPDNARCDQFVLQAPTPEGVLARALYRYRLGAIARVFLQHPLQSPLPPWLAAALRWVGGVIVILLAILFQLAAVGFILGMLSEQAPPSSGIAAAFFPLFGLFGVGIVLLPVYCPRLATGQPSHWSKRLQRWLTGSLLAGEYSAFLYAAVVSGHLWDASLVLVAGFFLWLTLTPVYAGAEIGRMLYGRGTRQERAKGAEVL
ncbi:MAG TPA: hypothetical protein VF099_12370 [Ktedonobacterales bacterium]